MPGRLCVTICIYLYHVYCWECGTNLDCKFFASMKLMLARSPASKFWAGWVENWPGQMEFCVEHNSTYAWYLRETSVFGWVLKKFSFPCTEHGDFPLSAQGSMGPKSCLGSDVCWQILGWFSCLKYIVAIWWYSPLGLFLTCSWNNKLI